MANLIEDTEENVNTVEKLIHEWFDPHLKTLTEAAQDDWNQQIEDCAAGIVTELSTPTEPVDPPPFVAQHRSRHPLEAR
jgi:hypothetical protein